MNPFITYILQTTLAISLFYMIYWLFLRKETFFNFNRYYFIISILAALALPFLDVGNAPVFVESVPVQAITGGYYYLENAVIPSTAVSSPEISAGYGFMDVLAWIYFAGVAFFLLRLVIQAIWLMWKISSSEKIEMSGMRIVLDEKAGSPFSFFSWVFLTPAEANEGNISEILVHEKEHISQKHSIDLLLIELLSAFQWINPFVWLLRRSIKETHEYLADHAVLRQGVPVHDYQKLLLSYAMGVAQPGLITPLNFSLNKKRMIMMKKMRSPDIRKWKSLFFLPLVLILSLAFSNSFTGEREFNDKGQIELRNTSDSLKIRPDALVYVLNGEVISQSEFKSLDPESIKAVEVWKGEKAVEKYGLKAEPGAIIITTKDQFENMTQNYRVTGRVINAESNEPLPDVNIVVKNTSRGTVSDEGGKFSLPLEKESEEVYFTYIGFTPLNLEVKNGEEVVVRLKRRPAMFILPPATGISWEEIAEEKMVKNKPVSNPEFVIVESMPEFRGGMQAFSNYIAAQINYPSKAKKNNVSGRVWVNFTIDKVGNVRNVYLDRGIDPDLDNEAIRIISGMPKWKPARQRGEAVPVELNINVDFVL